MSDALQIQQSARRMAMIVHSYYPRDVRVRREALAMREAGWEVDVICLREVTEAPHERIDGIVVLRLPLGRSRGSRLRYAIEYALFWCMVVWKLTVRTRRRHYSLVQVHTLPDFLVFAAAGAKRAGAKVLLDLHEIAPEFYQQKFDVSPRSAAVRLLSLIEQASIRYADKAITVNEPVRDRFLARGTRAEKIEIVMNSADEQLFPPKSSSYFTKETRMDRLSLVYHGSFLPIYGIDLAIRAIAALRTRWCFQLHLLGSGEAAEELRRLASELGVPDAVRFSGRVPQPEIARRLHTMAGGIVPTRPGPISDLSLSNKLLEMACVGLPIICARLPSYERIFPEGTVIYFKPADMNELTAALDRFAAMPDARRRDMAGAAFEAYSPWRWQSQRRRYVDLAERLAQISSGGSQNTGPGDR